jgi:hypothetical protein
MPEDRIPARRAALVLDVTQAASEVSRLIHECRDLHLPVEPGVRDGRLEPAPVGEVEQGRHEP